MVQTLTDEQYVTFMVRINDAPVRDRCMLLLLLHAGMRNGELCALRFRDLYSGKVVFSSIEVANGHGHHDLVRLLPLSPALTSALEQYYAAYVQKFGTPDPLSPAFITRNLKIGIQPRDVQRICGKHTRLWLDHAFHPHALRHTFATRLMRKASMRVVQQLLGHLSITSTQVYTHPSSEDCSNAVNQAF